MKADRTIERNYVQYWRCLIAEYESVRAGRSSVFCKLRDFYEHHRTCSQTFRKYYNRYRASGSEGDLLPRRRGPKCRERSAAELEQTREALFRVLHSPPSEFGFNRTSWKRDDLQQALRTSGFILSKRAIRSVVKTAGYRWIKAKKF